MPDTRFSTRRILRLSPWLLAGGAVILGLAVLVMAAGNMRKEKERMTQSLTARASALIWALEAGSRTHMALRAGNPYLQLLLEETAKQPDILYMAITDAAGRIVAHSARVAPETSFVDPETLAALDPSDSTKWRITQQPDGRRIFEVYKVFSPLPGFRHHRAQRMRMMMGGLLPHEVSPPPLSPAPSPNAPRVPPNAPLPPEMRPPAQPETCPPACPGRMPEQLPAETTRIIFAGLDAGPLEEMLSSDLRSAVVNSLLVGLAAFAGFVSLFWAHNYRVSRRLLQDARAFAAEMVGSLPLGLLTCDASGRIALANAAAAEMLGMERNSLFGRPLGELPGMDWAAIPADLEKGEPVLERESDLIRPDGPPRPISLSASRIVNEGGLFLGYLFIMRDLQEIRRLRRQLQRSERLSALGNLAAGVAHEIRNPLSSIKGFATFLKGKTEGQDKEAAAMLIDEVDRLNRVVSGLLEFARPDTVTLARVDLHSIVERALRLCSPDLAAQSISLESASDPALPPLMLDEDKLTQALLNLFLNAVQAMENGGVLRVSAALDPAGGKVLLRVGDTGKGIAPEDLSSIFDPYVTTRAAGTGLGLALVHRIVEQHGGSIGVESEPGRGSVFTISLPLPA